MLVPLLMIAFLAGITYGMVMGLFLTTYLVLALRRR